MGLQPNAIWEEHNFWLIWGKLSFSHLKDPQRLINSQLYPPHPTPQHTHIISSTCLNFWNEMWEMGQFTAKGCFFLRDTDIKMEYWEHAEVDGGEKKRLNLDREKKRKEKMWDRKARCRHWHEHHVWGLAEVLELHFLAFNFSFTKRLESNSGSWSFQSATKTRAAQIFNKVKQKREKHGEVCCTREVWKRY